MCGISATLGEGDYSLIIQSLLNLQNRGYDSAGIGILNTNLYNFKELGLDSIKNFIF